MTITIPTHQALVDCKDCGTAVPSLSKSKPVLPVRVQCPECGARRMYRGAEVYVGCVPRRWMAA